MSELQNDFANVKLKENAKLSAIQLQIELQQTTTSEALITTSVQIQPLALMVKQFHQYTIPYIDEVIFHFGTRWLARTFNENNIVKTLPFETVSVRLTTRNVYNFSVSQEHMAEYCQTLTTNERPLASFLGQALNFAGATHVSLKNAEFCQSVIQAATLENNLIALPISNSLTISDQGLL